MKNLVLKIVMAAMVMGLAEYCLAMPDPDQKTKAMTVSELEAAADVARAQKDYPKAIEALPCGAAEGPQERHALQQAGDDRVEEQ